MHLNPNIVAVTLEYRVRTYVYRDAKIACRAAVCALVALTARIYNLTVVNTRRNINGERCGLTNSSRAVTFLQGESIIVPFRYTSDRLLSLKHTERSSLRGCNLTFAVTIRARFGRSTGSGTAAVTFVADLYSAVCDITLTALCRLFKRYGNSSLSIGTALRCVGV